MNMARFAAQASLISLSLLLAACGGGGGGSVASAPTPAPSPIPTTFPSGANDDLLTPLLSETFANLSVTGSANYPAGGAGGTTSSGIAAVTFTYNAANGTYTVSNGGRSQSFSNSDKDASLSNGQITVYVKDSGATADSLTLSNPGTSGILTYKYVGSGFWQRTSSGSSSTSAALDGFVYGVQTPAMQIPRTGAGQYSVDLQGVHAYPDGVNSMTGTGEILVNFASGAMIADGYLDEYRIDGSWNGFQYWEGQASLSATGNSFSGQFLVGSVTGMDFRGMFFGPHAAEVGAVFNGSGNGTSVVGTLIGRYEGAPPPVLVP